LENTIFSLEVFAARLRDKESLPPNSINIIKQRCREILDEADNETIEKLFYQCAPKTLQSIVSQFIVDQPELYERALEELPEIVSASLTKIVGKKHNRIYLKHEQRSILRERIEELRQFRQSLETHDPFLVRRRFLIGGAAVISLIALWIIAIPIQYNIVRKDRDDASLSCIPEAPIHNYHGKCEDNCQLDSIEVYEKHWNCDVKCKEWPDLGRHLHDHNRYMQCSWCSGNEPEKYLSYWNRCDIKYTTSDQIRLCDEWNSKLADCYVNYQASLEQMFTDIFRAVIIQSGVSALIFVSLLIFFIINYLQLKSQANTCNPFSFLSRRKSVAMYGEFPFSKMSKTHKNKFLALSEFPDVETNMDDRAQGLFDMLNDLLDDPNSRVNDIGLWLVNLIDYYSEKLQELDRVTSEPGIAISQFQRLSMFNRINHATTYFSTYDSEDEAEYIPLVP